MSEEKIDVNEVASVTALADLKPKMKLKGTVNRLELYGAFVDLGFPATAILHISQLNKRVNRVSDLLSVGDEVEVWVSKVDADRNQVTVTMNQPLAVEWSDLEEGQVYSGKVVRLENFGAFIDIGAEKEGLIHVSELSHEFVKHPSEVLRTGDDVQVKVLAYSKKKRRINLSMKALIEAPAPAVEQMSAAQLAYEEEEEEEPEPVTTAMQWAWQQARDGNDGPPIKTKQPQRRRNEREDKRNRRQQEEILYRTLSMADND
jgi:small subunit ribosomal protein S1